MTLVLSQKFFREITRIMFAASSAAADWVLVDEIYDLVDSSSNIVCCNWRSKQNQDKGKHWKHLVLSQLSLTWIPWKLIAENENCGSFLNSHTLKINRIEHCSLRKIFPYLCHIKIYIFTLTRDCQLLRLSFFDRDIAKYRISGFSTFLFLPNSKIYLKILHANLFSFQEPLKL